MINPQDQYIGKIVVFNKNVDKIESNFDVGMKARVIAIDVKEDDVWRVYFDFSEFNEYNKLRALPNYYDFDGKPTMTWWEKSYFPKNFKHEEYADPNELHFDLYVEEVEKIYVVIGSSSAHIYQATWNVKSFKNKDAADSLCTNAQKRADEIFKAIRANGKLYYDEYNKEVHGANEFDPKMQFCGSDKARYKVEELELV